MLPVLEVEKNEKMYTLFIAPEPLNTRCDAREKCRQFLGKESEYWYGNKDLLYLQEEEAPPLQIDPSNLCSIDTSS